jgi:uncharacterized membrane protein (TIGR02234 family)
MSSEGRSLRLHLALLLVGALLVLWGCSLAWLSSTMPDSISLTPVRLRRTGAELRPALRALGFVALAGVPAVVALRGFTRRLVAALIGVVSGVVVALVSFDALRYRRQPGVGDLAIGPCRPGSELCTIQLHRPVAGPALVLVGVLLLLAAGVVAAARGGQWQGLGSSYDAPGGVPERPVTEMGVWDALDRGDDPTA